ncbi:sigma-54 dependent transcriptional regulator [Polaromonas sp.]|uniref:sigma-54-dependent transcriptional regulator n=1 Tax=Polaromonas sp. TaxID=1869339 RepID=UPI002730F45D|nr:sigma-54 dependent transcriptional regulator [Polaromonas sp.]MDP2451426.1 sigma-54 dependent transcriptional regulator [Polaromonas sp.]
MLIDLIEDDPLMGEALTERLQIEGFECRWWQSALQVRESYAQGQRLPDAVVSDIRLPDMEGPELQEALPPAWRQIPWIFITGYGTAAQRHELLARGAVDFFTKPLDMDRLMQRLHSLNPAHAPALAQPVSPACPLGISGEMRKLHALVNRLGPHWDSVLITGESGSGKEELARCLHRETLGAEAPFVPVNATSLPESLIEAELFGYEKGAFTGATRMHKGLFEQARGGTLFLDEIGDMPASLQVKLLRVIQDRTVTRLGSEKPQLIQVRLIFATHKRLNEEVRAGRFREDLYYRINVVHLQVPPLRERPEDVTWLAQRFVNQWNESHPSVPRHLTAEAEEILGTRIWPGNVRELHNCIEKACLLSEAEKIDLELLRDRPGDGLNPSAPIAAVMQASSEMPQLEEFLRAQERIYIQQALARHDWQIGVTADALGISRKNLWERMKRLSIQ